VEGAVGHALKASYARGITRRPDVLLFDGPCELRRASVIWLDRHVPVGTTQEWVQPLLPDNPVGARRKRDPWSTSRPGRERVPQR
jgi:hypothetical protein